MQSITLYKRLLKYVKPHWKFLVVMLVATVVYASTNALYVSQLKTVIDEGFIEKNMNAIYTTVSIVAVVTIFRGIGFFASNYASTRVSSNIVKAMRDEMFAQLQRLPTRYFDRVNSGQTLSRFNYHVSQVTNAATSATITVVQESVTIMVLLGYLLYQNWKMTLLIFVIVPVMALVIRLISKRLRKLAEGIQGSVGNMNHILDENIKGQKIVKIYSGSEQEEKKFNRATREIRDGAIKSEIASSASTPIIELMIVAVICLIIVLMALESKTGNLTPGAFMSYTLMMGLLPRPIKKLMKVNVDIQKGLAASDEIFAFLDEKCEPSSTINYEDKEKVATLPRSEGGLTFEKVFFAYDEDTDNAQYVLQDFSLNVRAGETIALVGPSGSGKSSVASLIPRFYDVTKGRVLLDGESIKEIDLNQLREQIAFVNQDTVLFDDTVARNIAYGVTTPDRERVKKAAQLAQAEGFILEMDNGYDSPIGEAGQRLSGGQRQRLTIARALYKDAPILIFDEATSALDSESERLVQKALDELLHDRTAIIIAHRLSTVKNADRIVVLDKGRIVESGTHDELMAKQGRFFHLNNSLEDLTKQGL